MSTLYDYENNDQDSVDKQRMYEACMRGSVEDITLCLENEKHVRSYIMDGMTPIHVIAISGRLDAVEILDLMLQKGIDVNSRTMGDMDTILHLVVERCNVQHVFPLVLKIMEFQPDLKLRNRSLRTPYDIALAKGYFELANVLDGSMTSVEAYNYYRQSIGTVYGPKLIRAVLDSREELIIDFTKLGADANVLNEHGNGAIHYAITHCTISPLRTLPLLLNAGADTNLQDAEGDTALNLAIKSEKLHENGELPKIVDLLLDRGALTTYRDLDGNDAMALARSRGYNDIIALLQRKRTQVPKKEKEENAELSEYLIRAVLEGTVDDVQEALRDEKANLNLYDKDGLTIVHHIINRDDGISDTDRQRIMEILIAAGANINAQTRKDKDTPLHLAASLNQVCSIEVLLKHKARYQLTNWIQYTPLKVAENRRHEEARQILDEHAKKEMRRMAEAGRNSGTCAIV